MGPGCIGTGKIRAIEHEVRGKIVTAIHVRQLGTPLKVGAVVAWLAGDDSGFITGAGFLCDGGLHMG